MTGPGTFPAAVREMSVPVRGRPMAVTHRPGAPGWVPLVLCNGIGTSWHVFDPLVAELDPRRPVVRFDVPGVGRSAPTALPYRYRTLAGALRRAVADLGYAHCDVLGISWGGGLAQQYAFQYPRHCRSMVLVATGTGVLMVPAGPRTLGRMLTPRRHTDPAYARAVAGELYGGSARTDPDRVITALHDPDAAAGPSMRSYLYQLGAIWGWSSLPFLPLIRQRTFVLAGDDDPLIPAVNGAIMSGLLPRATLHRYRGGHLALVTDAATLAPLIERFLDAGGVP